MTTMHVTVGHFANTELKAIRATSRHLARLHGQISSGTEDVSHSQDSGEIDRAMPRDDQDMAKSDDASASPAAVESQTTAGTAMTTQFSDPAKTALDLATANTAYQAALQTAAAIGQGSLVDFLR
jgi:hypothetical protein